MAQIRHVRIFSPPTRLDEYDRWAETMIGQIVAPVVRDFEASLDWFWFTRYVEGRAESAVDCDLAAIPPNFMHQEAEIYQSMRFRYSVATSDARTLKPNVEYSSMAQVARFRIFVHIRFSMTLAATATLKNRERPSGAGDALSWSLKTTVRSLG